LYGARFQTDPVYNWRMRLRFAMLLGVKPGNTCNSIKYRSRLLAGAAVNYGATLKATLGH
jgi:hypothetical protein